MVLLAQIFNFVNARKLNNDFNIFEGIHRSYIFLAILAFIIGAQVPAAPSAATLGPSALSKAAHSVLFQVHVWSEHPALCADHLHGAAGGHLQGHWPELEGVACCHCHWRRLNGGCILDKGSHPVRKRQVPSGLGHPVQ
jgi:hypothetical protein